MTADIAFDESGLSEDEEIGQGIAEPTAGALIVRIPASLGADATAVKTWFDEIVEVEAPVLDGSLANEREAAEAYARMAKAENTRRAYRAAVRAWCEWCRKRDLPPLPGSGAEVAAFLASERGRGLTPETLKLRRAAIRYLHRSAGCPVPTDDVAVPETLAGIRRQAERQGQTPRKNGRGDRRHPPADPGAHPNDLCGLRDRAPILTGCAGPSWRRSASSSWRRPSAGCASPCTRPKVRRPTR